LHIAVALSPLEHPSPPRGSVRAAALAASWAVGGASGRGGAQGAALLPEVSSGENSPRSLSRVPSASTDALAPADPVPSSAAAPPPPATADEPPAPALGAGGRLHFTEQEARARLAGEDAGVQARARETQRLLAAPSPRPRAPAPPRRCGCGTGGLRRGRRGGGPRRARHSPVTRAGAQEYSRAQQMGLDRLTTHLASVRAGKRPPCEAGGAPAACSIRPWREGPLKNALHAPADAARAPTARAPARASSSTRTPQSSEKGRAAPSSSAAAPAGAPKASSPRKSVAAPADSIRVSVVVGAPASSSSVRRCLLASAQAAARSGWASK